MPPESDNTPARIGDAGQISRDISETDGFPCGTFAEEELELLPCWLDRDRPFGKDEYDSTIFGSLLIIISQRISLDKPQPPVATLITFVISDEQRRKEQRFEVPFEVCRKWFYSVCDAVVRMAERRKTETRLTVSIPLVTSLKMAIRVPGTQSSSCSRKRRVDFEFLTKDLVYSVRSPLQLFERLIPVFQTGQSRLKHDPKVLRRLVRTPGE